MKGMLSLKELFNSDAVRAICWTLAHSLWQGLVIAAIAGLFLVMTKRSRPAFRYNMLSGLFVLFMLGTVFTFVYEQQNFELVNLPQTANYPKSTTVHTVLLTATAQPEWQSRFPAVLAGFLSRQAPLIVALWLIVLSLKSIKIIFSLGYTSYIRKRKAHESGAYWKNKLASLCTRLGISRMVNLVESEAVKLPVVFGHFKPVIFIPLGLLVQLPAGQVEAILLHELAHIRRNDYLVNLLQNMVEMLFFFNPALLWLSSLIRDERENCCDEMAIGQTGDKKQFIAALIGFRELSARTVPTIALAFPGNRNSLLNRVTRIACQRNYTLNRVEKGGLLAGCLLAMLLATLSAGPVALKPAKTSKLAAPQATSMLTVQAVTNHMEGSDRSAKAAHTHARSVRTKLVRDTGIKDTILEKKADSIPFKKKQPSYFNVPETIAAITQELLDQRLITDTNSLVIELTNTHLLVNGTMAPDGTWQKFYQAYLLDSPYTIDPDRLKAPGFGIYYNSITHSTGIGIRRVRPTG